MLLRVIGYAAAFFVLLLAVAKCSPAVVFADPCSIQFGYPIIPSVYANTIINVIVPISATCSASYGNQLYATGTANDLNTDTSAGTVDTILTSVNGGYTFTGQLGFNLPPSTQGHWVQIAVTVYNNQPSTPLTTSGEAFQINPPTVQVVTTTVTQSSSSEFAPEMPQQPHTIFAYVAIAAILTTVIIVTVGLLAYSRRPAYYQRPIAY